MAHYNYGSDYNILPTLVYRGVADYSLYATTSYSSNNDGDVIYLTGANNLFTRYIYDANRRTVAVIGTTPDPGQSNRATKTVYDGSGQVVSVSQGTAPGQSDSAAQAFHALQTRTNAFVNGQLISTTDFGGIATRRYTYDTASRLLTTTLDMQGQGANRVTTNAYSSTDGRLTSTTTGAGADVIAVSYAYSDNGNKTAMTDGAQHTTGYAYDG